MSTCYNVLLSSGGNCTYHYARDLQTLETPPALEYRGQYFELANISVERDSIESQAEEGILAKQNKTVPLGKLGLTFASSNHAVSEYVAGDELHCLPERSRIYGKWAANIHDGSTPGGKAITRCITPDPALLLIWKAHPAIEYKK